MTELPPFPETASGDSDDVNWALETGRSMWAQGDLHEALRWLKRAADSASEDEDDIRSLVSFYLNRYARDLGRKIKEVSPEALDLMMQYEWAGNVRELQNVIERAILISDGDTIRPEHLPLGVRKEAAFEPDSFEQKLSIEEYTKAFILRNQAEYNEQQIADMLGITRKSLWEKRKKWGMSKGK